ncbi:MAG: tRNA1(Val) (adenine(37)-N6)-methyltransferase [Clostridia bacterium]|nr:tRNA1(Val) (adenine(37)-N6)-methyltransferase [Clostridia bacterium]
MTKNNKEKVIDIVLGENERIDDLQIKNFKIIQNKAKYCFSTDAVLLANFIKTKKNQVLVDLCSGSGVIPILVLAKNALAHAYGIELQQYLYDLATKSAKLNELENVLTFFNAPINEYNKYFEKGSIDVVSCNPPYEKVEGHYLGSNADINTCKYETHLTLEEVVKVASELLKFGGKFYMVHKSSRLTEIIFLLKTYKLEPKVIRFVQPKVNLNSNVILIEASKDGKSGLIVKPNLIINNLDGSYTDEFKKIYGDDNK